MSEFGKGLTYCLGLFLAHQYDGNPKDPDYPTMWFHAASDHLYELAIPESLPDNMKCRLEALRDMSLDFGHNYDEGRMPATKSDVQFAVEEAMRLLMEIDRHLGIQVEEAKFK